MRVLQQAKFRCMKHAAQMLHQSDRSVRPMLIVQRTATLLLQLRVPATQLASSMRMTIRLVQTSFPSNILAAQVTSNQGQLFVSIAGNSSTATAWAWK